MTKPEVRNKWQTKRLKTKVEGKSKAQQNLKDRTDINNIMAKYNKTGLIDWVKDPLKADYGDFSEVTDYQTALHQVMEAQEAFMTLSAKVRNRFSNDPAKFLQFMADPTNKDEAIALGLLPKPDVTTSPKSQPAPNGAQTEPVKAPEPQSGASN